MIPHRSARTCRWAQPVVFVPLPGWIKIWPARWACLGDDRSRTVLDARSDCANCARWTERPDDDRGWILTQAAI